jgi:hypothetical protein
MLFAISGDEASIEVFLLVLDGSFADRPSMELLKQLLAARFSSLDGSSCLSGQGTISIQ